MKKYVSVLLIIVLVLTTTGCNIFGISYYLEQEQAKKNAVAYFKEHYNIDVEAINAERIGGCAPFCTYLDGYKEVTVKYNNKEYSVNIADNKNSTEGYDNYKNEIIKNDMQTFLNQYNVQ